MKPIITNLIYHSQISHPFQLFYNTPIQFFISGCSQRTCHSFWYSGKPPTTMPHKNPVEWMSLWKVEGLELWNQCGNEIHWSRDGIQQLPPPIVIWDVVNKMIVNEHISHTAVVQVCWVHGRECWIYHHVGFKDWWKSKYW